MNRITPITGSRILCAAIAPMMLLAFAPLPAYAAEHPVTITVNQIFHASPDAPDSTFTYRLRALDQNNPISVGNKADYTFTISGSGSVEVGAIRYNRNGIYCYELFQVIQSEKPGYTYDKRLYTIEAHVDSALGVNIIVLNEDGTKAGGITFENGYAAPPNTPVLMTSPPVCKTVSGNPGKNSVFTFQLTAQSASFPMPDGSVDGVKTIQITGGGESDFGTWGYNKPGVYAYTVFEVNTGESGYTYDTAVYTVTDTVREDNGQLAAHRVITNDLHEHVTSFTFINEYTGQNGEPPKTGDDMDISFYVALLILSGVLILCAVSYWVLRRKGREVNE